MMKIEHFIMEDRGGGLIMFCPVCHYVNLSGPLTYLTYLFEHWELQYSLWNDLSNKFYLDLGV